MPRPPRRDLLLAAVAIVALQADLWLIEPGGPRGVAPVTVLAAAAFGAAFAWQRARPALLAAIVTVTIGVQGALGGELTTTVTMQAAAMAAAFLIGLRLPRRDSVLAAAAFLVAAWIDAAVDHDPEYSLLSDLVFTAVIAIGGPWLAGRALADRHRRTEELEDLTRQLAVEREATARMAVLDERARIAREMHDVVAHSVSLMVVQSGAARQLLDDDPEQTRTALRAVEDEGRAALAELRRVLGILRGQPGETQLEPQPSTARLGELLERTRRAGLPVELQVSGTPRPLPAGLDVAVYRIVQEALTNAVKHAGAGRASVRLGYGAGELTVAVEDDGRASNGHGPGAGHGIVGMRERAAAYGGTLDAGRSETGGFSVRARLPLEAAP